MQRIYWQHNLFLVVFYGILNTNVTKDAKKNNLRWGARKFSLNQLFTVEHVNNDEISVHVNMLFYAAVKSKSAIKITSY